MEIKKRVRVSLDMIVEGKTQNDFDTMIKAFKRHLWKYGIASNYESTKCVRNLPNRRLSDIEIKILK